MRSTTRHLDDAVAALDMHPVEDLAQTAAIIPGPGGRAPEAYAR